MNTNESYMTVEGLRCDDLEHANTLAQRFYDRYNKQRTIDIIVVNIENGVRTEHKTTTAYQATKSYKPECPNTMDLF